MVLTKRVVSKIFLTILTIDGIHSIPRSLDNSLGLLSDIIGEDSRSPFVVVIRSAQDVLDNEMMQSSNQDYSSSNDNHISARLESVNDLYDAMIKDKNDDIYNNMLRTNDKVNKLEQEKNILNALRSRCQAIVECTEKCPKEKPKDKCSESSDKCSESSPKCSESSPKCSESSPKCSESSPKCSESLEKCTEEDSCGTTTTKKPEKYCPKSCKAVFDHLLNCPPPGNDKKKDRHKNQSTKAHGPPTGKTLPPNWKHGLKK